MLPMTKKYLSTDDVSGQTISDYLVYLAQHYGIGVKHAAERFGLI